MRRYELVFVLAPALTDDEVDQLVELYTRTAREKGAEVITVDKWGKRRLAYPVQKHHEGHYVVLTVEELSGAAVTELERRFRVTDSVIRFLSVRVDEELKRAEKFKKRKEVRLQRLARKRAEVSREALAEKE